MYEFAYLYIRNPIRNSIQLKTNRTSKVLISPLEWGLGHATRCIPLIRELLSEGAEVLIAADGGPLALLKEEFPQLTFITLPGYNITYSGRLPMALSMLFQSPKILFKIFREHRLLKKIIMDYGIDCIISDNRYGLWNKSIHSVFITHQMSIKPPSSLKFLEPLLYSINKFFIKKFDELWIPDAAGENNLSGELSHTRRNEMHSSFIGLLSRFNAANGKPGAERHNLLAIISGPEPHRSLLLETLLAQAGQPGVPALIVGGEPQKKYDTTIRTNIRLVSHLNADEMLKAIMQSEVVICRAGYSGIMDLVSLDKKAILIPTPGQTEQEYLAWYLKEKKMFYAVSQEDFNLETALKEYSGYGDFSKTDKEKKYPALIKKLLQHISKS